jgi:hypothetical protein
MLHSKESRFQCSAPSAPSSPILTGTRTAKDGFTGTRKAVGILTPAASEITSNAKETPPADQSTPMKPPATYHPPADDDNLTTVWFSPAGEIVEVIPARNHRPIRRAPLA